MLEPTEGRITFRAEGNNIKNSHNYSRVIHWPGYIKQCSLNKSRSGVTIGRGYDMRDRDGRSIISDLTRAGIPIEQARKISLAAGLHNCNASLFVKKYRNEIGEITEIQQLNLFKITYSNYAKDSIRFYYKYSSSDALKWDELDTKIKDVFIDMKYQGVLNRKNFISFEKNSTAEVIQMISSSDYLLGFEHGRNRIKYLKEGK